MKVKKILFFEIPSSTEWKITTNKKKVFNPNWFEISAEDVSFNLYIDTF